MSLRNLSAYNIYKKKTATLQFEGGICVSGKIITGKRNLPEKIILINFKHCTVRHNDTILFKLEWGIFDMLLEKQLCLHFQVLQIIKVSV